MDSIAENGLCPRKEWVRPELRKIDIEQITALQTGNYADGRWTHASSNS
jgi:hypothetical protein